MTDNKPTTEILGDPELEAFFKAERDASAGPSDALMQAVLRDAQKAQPDVKTLTSQPPVRWSFRRDVWNAIGGWGAAATLTACLVFGVSIGYSSPDDLSSLTEKMLSSAGISESESDYFSLDDLMAEG